MRQLLLLAVLVSAAAAARAENGLYFVGVEVARNSVSDITGQGGAIAPDLKNTSWKFYAGVRPLSWLGAEVGYVDLGRTSSTSNINSLGSGSDSIKGYTFAGYAVGFLPLPLPVIDVFGKVGVASGRFDGTFYQPGISGSFGANSTGFAWGVGIQGHVSLVGTRLEYEHFNMSHSSGAKVVSLSVYLNLGR